MTAEKALQVVEEAAWAQAGGPEKAWLVLGAAVSSGRDSVMEEELGGQPTGLACLAGSGPSPELKVESVHIYAVEAHAVGPKPVLARGWLGFPSRTFPDSQMNPRWVTPQPGESKATCWPPLSCKPRADV